LNKLKSKEKLKSSKKSSENLTTSSESISDVVSSIDTKSDQNSTSTSSISKKKSFSQKLKSFSSRDNLDDSSESSTQKKKDTKKDKKSKKNETVGPFICLWMKDNIPCNIEFESAEFLYKHLCDDHVGRKANNNLCLTCHWNNCNFTKNKRDHITSHLRKHISFKPFVCQICDRAFKRPQDLKKHKIVHEEDRSKLLDLKSTPKKYEIKIENSRFDNNGIYTDKINTIQYRKLGKNENSPKQTIGKRPPDYENFNISKRQADNESVLKQINYNNQASLNAASVNIFNNKGSMQNYISNLNEICNKQNQTTVPSSYYNPKPLLHMNSNASFTFSGKSETANHVFGVTSNLSTTASTTLPTFNNNNDNINKNNNNNVNTFSALLSPVSENSQSPILNTNNTLTTTLNNSYYNSTNSMNQSLPTTNTGSNNSFSTINTNSIYLDRNISSSNPTIETSQPLSTSSYSNPNIQSMMNLPPLSSNSDSINNISLMNNTNNTLLDYEYAHMNGNDILSNNISHLKNIIQSDGNPLNIVEAFFDSIIKNEIQPLYNSDMLFYLDCLNTILQDQNFIKQLNIFQNSEDFNKVINFLSCLMQHTEHTEQSLIQEFGFQDLNLLNNTTKASNVDEYDFDPELMNTSIEDYLVDIPNSDLLLSQPAVVQSTLPKPELISQPIFNPCEEIVDEIIEEDDGIVNRYDTVVGLNKNIMGMLSPQGYTSGEDTSLASNSPLFIDSMKSSFPLTPPPQQVPYEANINTANTLATTSNTFNSFSSVPNYNNINSIKLESMDSFNELDKLQKGRYRIVRDVNDERPTVQLVLNNNENFTAATDSLLNNYTSFTLNATQSKNTGRSNDQRDTMATSSNTSSNKASSSSTVKNTSTQPVVIKQEYNSNRNGNYNNSNRSNYFNSDISYNSGIRKNRPSTSPSDNKISLSHEDQQKQQSKPQPSRSQPQPQQNTNGQSGIRHNVSVNTTTSNKSTSIHHLMSGNTKNEADLEQMQDKFKEMSLSKSTLKTNDQRSYLPSIHQQNSPMNSSNNERNNSNSNQKPVVNHPTKTNNNSTSSAKSANTSQNTTTNNNDKNRNNSTTARKKIEKMEEHKMFIQRLNLLLKQARIQIPNLLLSPTLS
jgi:hypothetical protein